MNGKKYFTFAPGTKSETMWMKIWHYLDANYDLEATKHIFISGDGAPWIRAGVEYIPNAHYVLDGFHLRKAIFKAAGADESNRKDLFTAIANGQRSEMNRLLFSLREEAEQESREKSIMDAQKYLNRQWDGIVAKRKYRSLLVGCSAEGQVSHILSARLSSRPMGWSFLGANQMASLRVHRENGVNVSSLHIKQSKKKNPIPKQFVEPTCTYMAKAVGSSYETFGNMPSLATSNRGWSTLLRRISNRGLSI